MNIIVRRRRSFLGFAHRLSDLLASYQEKYPHVNTHITTDQSRNLYLQLLDNTIDVAILRGEYDDWKGEKILLDREKSCAIYNQQDENASLSKLPFIDRKTDIELERELIMSTIEDSHPLGRLFDMDVIDSDGNKLSRTVFRKCLICNAQAQICASSRNHSVVEMQHKIVELLNDFFI